MRPQTTRAYCIASNKCISCRLTLNLPATHSAACHSLPFAQRFSLIFIQVYAIGLIYLFYEMYKAKYKAKKHKKK